jgi:signal transduction histidine kinase
VDQAIQDVREMSQLLRPTILDDFGLDAALRVLTDGFAKRTGLALKYESDLGGERLKDETETSLYRIAQEALTNVARHSEATAVEMSVAKRTPNVVLEIRDNGKGIDMAVQRTQRGLGLAGMQTRVRGCGGTVRIESTPGKGLRVEVTCPIAR